MGRCKPPGSENSFLSYAPQPSGTKSCFFVPLKEWQYGRRLILAFPCPRTPVFLPVKSHGQRSLADYHPWGCRVGQDWATKHSTEPLPAPQQSLWGVVGGILQFGEPSSTFGGQKLLMSVPFIVHWYVKRYFHFRGRSLFLIQYISLRVPLLSLSRVWLFVTPWTVRGSTRTETALGQTP